MDPCEVKVEDKSIPACRLVTNFYASCNLVPPTAQEAGTMNHPSPSSCPKCGASIPENAPQGLCPKCVLAGAAAVLDPPRSPSGKTPTPTVQELAPHFPELEILELIGAGGMGAVYKARQPKLDRLVALKILSHDLAADPAFTERFNREARVLARLNHQNIVTVFDFGTQGPFCFLLMEFMDGVNLRQAMRTGGFSPTETLVLVQDVCAALKFAHEKGILHRDIKPENILIDASGRVKIADFGIAKIVGENDRENVTLTQHGSVLGSPRYMAPEQFESPGDVDQRADIYSLGVVLYEMLTGELPIGRFAAPSTKSAMDARIDAIVMRTLEKERELRFQTIGEVKTRMENVTQSPGVGTTESVGASTEAPGAAPARSTARFATVAAVCTGLSLALAVVFIPASMFSLKVDPGYWMIVVLQLALFLGVPAILGFDFGVRAVREIRSSGGKLAGLKRAIASVLSWPALLVMLMVFSAISMMFADNGVATVWRMLLAVLLLVTSGLGVVMIVRIFRRTRDHRPAAGSVGAHVWRFAATASVAAVCVFAYVREERATREAYLDPTGTKWTIGMDILSRKMVDFRVVRIDLDGNETPLGIEGTIAAPVGGNVQAEFTLVATNRWKESSRQKIEAGYEVASGEAYRKSVYLDDHWKFTTSGNGRSQMLSMKQDRMEVATRSNWLGKKVETLYFETVASTHTEPAPAVEKHP